MQNRLHSGTSVSVGSGLSLLLSVVPARSAPSTHLPRRKERSRLRVCVVGVGGFFTVTVVRMGSA